jgi:hypothetical protein
MSSENLILKVNIENSSDFIHNHSYSNFALHMLTMRKLIQMLEKILKQYVHNMYGKNVDFLTF